MSQVDSVCTEKTCLSHIYDAGIYVEQLDRNKSVVLILAILSLNSTFWLRLKLQFRTKGFKVKILTENSLFISNNV